MKVKKIFVTVLGGVAEVLEETVPHGFEVEVIDFYNIEAGDSFPSREARRYCQKHRLYTAPRKPSEVLEIRITESILRS